MNGGPLAEPKNFSRRSFPIAASVNLDDIGIFFKPRKTQIVNFVVKKNSSVTRVHGSNMLVTQGVGAALNNQKENFP
jgi:hypothetical protein